MSQALVKNKQEAFTTMEAFLMDPKAQNAIARVLPSGMSAERLVRFAMAATTRQPDLLLCTPQSVFLSLLDASYYGLEPNPVLGHAYLIPYGNKKTGKKECTFMIGWKGYLVLADRSGLLSGMRVEAVYEGDEFQWLPHMEPPFVHKVNLDADRSPEKIKYVYCVVKLKNALWQGVALNRGQVERYRNMSHARDRFAWQDSWDAMALKTAVRRCFSKLPLSAGEKLGVAIAQDVALDLGEPVRHSDVLNGVVSAPELIDRGESLAEEIGAQGSE